MIRRTFLAAGGASWLGACAGLSETEVIRRWPPLGKMLEVDGLPVHVWDEGAGQPVVLIHGASGNLRDWTFALAPMLSRSYRVLAFDRPGFGYSARLPSRGWDPRRQAAHLALATRQLTDQPPIVVGHSWGGAVAMGWGVNEPEAVRGIVSLAGATMPWGGSLSFFYTLAASDVTGGAVSSIVNAVISERRIASFLTSTFAPQSVPDGYPDYIGGLLATRPATIRYNARDLMNLDSMLQDQSARYGEIRTPVEILHGTADDTVHPQLHAEGMHARLPNARLTLLDGVGHMPHHARPEALSAAIARLAG